ncbi:MAG: hypothetical protein HGA85_04435 [Nanoarchaeota archaeon]|nr:hypothetical protein [Nanoarchaeota archaeon]
MAKGFGFIFERQDSPGKHTHNWKIPKKTNLDILVETQVAQDFEVLQPLPPGITSAAYDLPSLITHDPDFHKVNFTWIEAIFNVAIESRLGYTAGARLMDNLHMLYQDEEIQRILFIGERARGYSAIADTSRLNVPWTCSRPEEQKMMKDVIVIDTFSEYNPDVPKRHQIMRAFMDRCQGKRTLVVDDLGATLNTMGPFLDVVKQYGGIPQGCTLIDLGYIPDAARVHLDFPRKSIFTEEKPSVVRFSPEFMRTVYSK